MGDLPIEEFRRLAHAVAERMADYLDTVEQRPVLAQVRPGEIRGRLPPHPPESGESLDEALDDFDRILLPGITHWNHPSFFGYFAISGSGPGILGEMLTAALNANAMVWRSSPAATELEEVVTDWLAQWLGLPGEFDGVINDTASSSTLNALAAARSVAYPQVREEGLFGLAPGRIYASDQAHSSVEKAVLTLGLGRSGFSPVRSDDRFRMDPRALRGAIRRDRAAGVVPVAVVATLGTTSSASIDPVLEIAEICREYDVWLHVDAAYGGPAAIVPELRPAFRGWEQADSIIVNPHKWLFTPIDCSILYCRRPRDLVQAFSIVPEYLTSAEPDTTRNLMDYGVALGRRFRALKLWMVMRYFGRVGVVDRIRQHVALARSLADRFHEAAGWELLAPVELATVAFRRVVPGLDRERTNTLNRRILDRVNATGEAFMTHTVLGGRVAQRVSVGNLRTTQAEVDRLWALLEQASAAELSEAPW